jgi:hypothetical protein
MRLLPPAHLAALAFGLTACVGAAPLELADDHPANPKAASGLVDAPTAIGDYASADDFAARAAADATSAGGHGGMQHGGMQHGGMPGMSGMQHGGMAPGAMPGMNHGAMPAMQHGDMQGMPGMQHGGALRGAGNR